MLWLCTPAQEGLTRSLTLFVRRGGDDDASATTAAAAADAVADEMESGRFWEGAEVEMPHEMLQDAAAGAVHEVCQLSLLRDVLPACFALGVDLHGSEQSGVSVDRACGGGIGRGGCDYQGRW